MHRNGVWSWAGFEGTTSPCFQANPFSVSRTYIVESFKEFYATDAQPKSPAGMYVHMYVCIDVYIYIYVCIDACICICIYVRTYVVGQSMAWHFKKITFNLSQSLGDRIKLTLLLLRSQGSVYQNQFCTQEPILRIYIQLHCQRCLKLQRQCCKNSQRQRSKILQRHE
jgi:hypothetical protein